MSTDFVAGPVRVRVPATSANLGPGFDALGLALALHDELTAEISDAGLSVEVEGAGAGDVPRDESHLVVRAMRRAFAELGIEPNAIRLRCRNAIPHSRGLGSSAAAIVGGVLLARGLVIDGAERLPDGAVLALAANLEGHPDNVAPCLFGGLTIAWLQDGEARAVRRDVDPAVVPVALVPPFIASTELARGLLPDAVSHADAAFAAGRAALLVTAITGTPQALFDATEDRLHQSYRASAMPEAYDLVERLRSAGHPAVISGAGPTVLVLARGAAEAQAASERAPDGWQARVLAVDSTGARQLS
jgi:homoserine kinase